MHFIGGELGDQLISSELCLSSEDAPDKVQDILNYEDPGIGNQTESSREKNIARQSFLSGAEKLMSVINGTHNAPFVTFSYE